MSSNIMKNRFFQRLIDFIAPFHHGGKASAAGILSLTICFLALLKPLEACSQSQTTVPDQAPHLAMPVDESRARIQPPESAREIILAVKHGPSEYINAWWWPTKIRPGAGPGEKSPAIILLHGCGGMLNRQGLPDQRMQRYAAWLGE
jgi:hypothetical protein